MMDRQILSNVVTLSGTIVTQRNGQQIIAVGNNVFLGLAVPATSFAWMAEINYIAQIIDVCTVNTMHYLIPLRINKIN